jgi:hypothetical protein
MRLKGGKVAGWSVLVAALLALVSGLTGVTPFGGSASGPQTDENAGLDGLAVLPGLGETVVSFGSPLDDQATAEAPPFGDAVELDARAGQPGRLAWAGPGEIVPAQFPSVALPGGIEPDFGDTSEPAISDAPFAAFGESTDGFAGFSSGSLGSFSGGGGNPNGPLPSGTPGGDLPPRGDPGGDPQVPEPSPFDLLQIALALLACLAYRRFRA